MWIGILGISRLFSGNYTFICRLIGCSIGCPKIIMTSGSVLICTKTYDGRKVTTYTTHQWHVVLEVVCVVYVGKPPTLHCVVGGLPTCCCWFANNNMLLLVYQHVVVGLPTTTCCCWFTNMLLLVYQQQHVVVGLPTCCCWFTNNNMLLLVYQHVVVGLPTTTCCCWFTNMLLSVYQQQHVVVGLPTCCCRFTNNNMLLLVYQHVVVGLPTTTCCCWFTNMLLSVYQQQHVVVGLPTCCCWYILQPTPPTPTHQGIPWNVEGFPLSWCVVFPSVILSLHVMIVLHCFSFQFLEQPLFDRLCNLHASGG